jgi:hypothetical protein
MMAWRQRVPAVKESDVRVRERGSAPATYAIDWTDPEKIPEQHILDFVEGHYEEGKARRQQWEAQAAEQLAWCRGNQLLRWDADARDLVEHNDEGLGLEFRDPVTMNVLKGYLLQYIAFMLGVALTWRVDPATRDDDDVSSSRVASKILDYYWRGGSIDGMTELLEAAWLQFATGVVWAKPLWDPARGALDSFAAETISEQGAPQTQEERESLNRQFKDYVKELRGVGVNALEWDEESGSIALPSGDISVDWVSGFDLTEPFNCKLAEEAPWIIHSRFRSMEYVRERYGEDATDEVNPDGSGDAYQYRYFEQYGDYSSTREQGSPPDEVMVHELWRPRSISAPQGCLAVVADRQILKLGRHPYLHGRLPFLTFREMPDPEHFRPGCTIRDLMSLQRARNTHRSYWHGHFRMTVDPRIMNEAGSGLPANAFTDGPKLIPLNEGGIDKVRPFQHDRMPEYTSQLDDRNATDMETIGGVHRSTTGRGESAQQSGRHAEVLRQGDAQRMTASRLLFEAAAARTGQQLLWLAWEFITRERTITITGEHGAYEVLTFKGQDVRRKKSSGLPTAWNITANLAPEQDINSTLAKIDILTQGGWMTPAREKDALQIKRWLGDHVTHETDDDGYHRCAANNENYDILSGKKVHIALGDDDAVHIDAHEHFTTLPEFRERATNSAQFGAEMLIHIRSHQYQFAEKLLRQQAIAEAVKRDLAEEFGLLPPMGPDGSPGGGASPQPGPQPQPGRPDVLAGRPRARPQLQPEGGRR